MHSFKQFLIKLFVVPLRWLYPYSMNCRINGYFCKLYSYWLRTEFKSIGNGVRFQRHTKITGGKYISIGNDTQFGERNMLSAWEKFKDAKYSPSIEIGERCSFGFCNHITCCNKITIGNDVLTGMYVIITDNNHGDITSESLGIPPLNRILVSKGEVVVGDNVWIGDKVSILSGVHIGKGSVIAANSVVTKDVPEMCVMAGCPARIIKDLRTTDTYARN